MATEMQLHNDTENVIGEHPGMPTIGYFHGAQNQKTEALFTPLGWGPALDARVY
jgi:hypothetical protein